MLRVASLLVSGAFLTGCASVPAPVTRSPQSPAHPEAPEAATPPLRPGLMSGAEEGLPTAPEPAADRHAGHSTSPPGGGGHEGHDTFTCSMHPGVTSDEPGSCPVCGMVLVKKEPKSGVER